MVGSESALSTLSFWALYTVTPLITIQILRRANCFSQGIDFLTVVFGYYWLIAFAGYGGLYLGLSPQRASMGVIDPATIAKCMILAGISMILMSIGVLAGQALAGQRDSRPTRRTARRLRGPQIKLLGAVFVLISLTTAVYLMIVPEIALFTLVAGSGDPAAARSAMTNAFTGPIPYHYFQLGFQSLAALCVFILIHDSINRRRALPAVISVIGLCAVLFVNVLDLQKAPAVWIVFGAFLTIMFSSPKRTQMKVLIAGIPVIFLMAFGIVTLAVGLSGRAISDVLATLFDRLLVGGITPAYFYVDLVPIGVPFLDGNTLPNPRGLLSWEHFPYTVFFHHYMSPEMAARGVTGSAPTAFWAEIYINFGVIGVLILAPIVGFLLQLVKLISDAYVPETLRPPLLAWLTLHFMKLAETGLSTYLFDEKLLATIGLIAAMTLLENRHRVNTTPRPSEVV